MKWHFMKRREKLEFLTYLPWSKRYKLLKKEEWKWDTLYVIISAAPKALRHSARIKNTAPIKKAVTNRLLDCPFLKR